MALRMVYLPSNPYSSLRRSKMLLAGVALLPGKPEVLFQDQVDDAGEGLHLGPPYSHTTPSPSVSRMY